MPEYKDDAGEIEAFWNSATQWMWLQRDERRLWHSYLYHYTDVQNAVRILQEGVLYSRAEAVRRGLLLISSGDPSILNQTDASITNCVRLYFRPRTPTQFWVEGIRSRQTLASSSYRDAHCPLPVFFLFNAERVLCLRESRFHDGSAAQTHWNALCTAAHELEAFPWREIYHTGWHERGARIVTHHKNAEVVVPNVLSLDLLKYVVCRSPAEKDTLLALLPQSAIERHKSIISSSQSIELYDRKHTYVSRAVLDSGGASIHFSPDTLSPGPFALRARVFADDGSPLEEYTDDAFQAVGLHRIQFRKEHFLYSIRIELDGHLAYQSTCDEIPF